MLWMRKDSAETSRLASLYCWTVLEPRTIYSDAEDPRNARVIDDYLASCSTENAPQ